MQKISQKYPSLKTIKGTHDYGLRVRDLSMIHR